MNQEKKLLEWILEHDCLSLNKIEIKTKIPKGTLRHSLKGRRNLTKNSYARLKEFLTTYEYKD